MGPIIPGSPDEQRNAQEHIDRKKSGYVGQFRQAYKAPTKINAPQINEDSVEKRIDQLDTAETPQIAGEHDSHGLSSDQQMLADGPLLEIEQSTTHEIPGVVADILDKPPNGEQTLSFAQLQERIALEAFATQAMPELSDYPTTPLPLIQEPFSTHQSIKMSRGKALLLIALLCTVLVPTLATSLAQFTGSQGWAAVLASPAPRNQRLLTTLGQHVTPTPGAKLSPTPTPAQYINQIINNMTLDEKLGQMMFVQFIGANYDDSNDLNTMIAQQNVGAVILSPGNNNIVNQTQLKNLTTQMQQNAQIPLLISTDQEGGEVDRLAQLDGARPSAAQVGSTGDPTRATQSGIQDAQDLASYGFNLNLAPVVDVDTLRNSIVHQEGRTYGQDSATVTKMAAAYLQGLQQSGKVFGTLKHFPGLGDVSGDPHYRVTVLNRSKAEMEQIDWAPYQALIQQGLVHAIMVTHEILPAIDNTLPASLSAKVVQNILRDEMGFQGVIMTDSLTMVGVTEYATLAAAAAMAVEAGSDLMMGAGSAADVTIMINGIKDAMSAGKISQQRIDESVRRILTMKYAMGLLSTPKN